MFIDLGGKLQEQIKPLHGVCCAPFFGSGDSSLFHYLGEAGIPYSRLHDTGGEFGRGVFVDIDNIFRDPDGIRTIPPATISPLPTGSSPTWSSKGSKRSTGWAPPLRTISGSSLTTSIRPRIFTNGPGSVPASSGITTTGWPTVSLRLEYWEIWNEPENEPDVADNTMWKGTIEEFFDLYVITANHLKKEFPEIKVGGYASCGFYAITAPPAPRPKVPPGLMPFSSPFSISSSNISLLPSTPPP